MGTPVLARPPDARIVVRNSEVANLAADVGGAGAANRPADSRAPGGVRDRDVCIVVQRHVDPVDVRAGGLDAGPRPGRVQLEVLPGILGRQLELMPAGGGKQLEPEDVGVRDLHASIM
jgi:hypothetical protein